MYMFKGNESLENIGNVRSIGNVRNVGNTRNMENMDSTEVLFQILEMVNMTTRELEDYMRSYNRNTREIERVKSRKSYYKHDALEAAISIVIALSVAISLPIGAHKLAKKLGEGKDMVPIRTTTYVKNLAINKKITKPLSDNPEDKAYIIETIPAKDSSYDLVMTYDASNEGLTKVKDYFDLDLSSLPLIDQETVTEGRENEASKKVVIEKVDWEFAYNLPKTMVLGVFYLVYILAICILESKHWDDYSHYFMELNVLSLINNIKRIRYCENTRELEKETKEIKRTILKILNSDKRLLTKFEVEYERNINLMGDASCLLCMYNELSNKITSTEQKLTMSK